MFWDSSWSLWDICQTEHLNSTIYRLFKDQYISSFTIISIVIILYWFVLLAFCITVHNLTAYTITNSTYTSSHCYIAYLYICCSHCAKTAPSAYHYHSYWLAKPPLFCCPCHQQLSAQIIAGHHCRFWHSISTLIRCSEFVRYWRKMTVKRCSTVGVYGPNETSLFSYVGGFLWYAGWGWYTCVIS